MDIYLEHMIKHKKTISETILSVLYYILAAAITFFLIFIKVPMVVVIYLPVIIFLLFYLAWFLNRNMRIEYEYILTNDEIDVDKIVGKSKRKRLLTVSVKKFEEIRPAIGEEFSKAMKDNSIIVKLDASEGEGSHNRYYATFINKLGQKMILVFNPTDEMLKNIKIYNMRNFYEN